MEYVAEVEPAYSGIATHSLMVPMQKHETPTMDFITKDEFRALETACDITTFLGSRDKLMLLILYNSGTRVSEMLSLKYSDIKGSDAIFHNKHGNKITRSGVRFRIEKLVKKASDDAPSLLEKNITPHSFRHSVAMNLLQSGVDISTISIWLGHSSIETTHKYMVSDIELKRKAMELAGASGNSNFKYKPSNDILAFLSTL